MGQLYALKALGFDFETIRDADRWEEGVHLKPGQVFYGGVARDLLRIGVKVHFRHKANGKWVEQTEGIELPCEGDGFEYRLSWDILNNAPLYYPERIRKFNTAVPSIPAEPAPPLAHPADQSHIIAPLNEDDMLPVMNRAVLVRGTAEQVDQWAEQAAEKRTSRAGEQWAVFALTSVFKRDTAIKKVR
jgi:hypothetical protein